ncbi:uncharacterized protein LOC132394603 [Hypanus sabinus]|uniref:uncharacterized protein LOC132394603 n=1 Tax=Hypanus sabinus TaxID=79690 RepID=UPI0028C5044F|nr:uncharacterized protein LOC132394603 [Hypanus sabinus]
MEKGCAQPEDVGEKKEKDNKFECIVRDGKRGGDGENLKCIYFNARSIVRKVDELKAWIDTWNYDVVAISETWLQEGCDWQLNIPGFSCFRCDRVGGARGGGVALLVRENLMAVLWKDRLESSSREAIWVELKNGKGAVTLIGVYYRPPNGARELEEQMCKEIADICSKHKVVIVGDFNFPHVDWEAHSVKGLDGLEFVKCVQDSFLQQYIEVPTRDGAVLDLLLGNAIGQLTDVCVGEHFGSSDHNSISFNIIMEKDRTGPRVEIFDWRKANFEGMRRDLERVDWVKLFYGKDVIEKWRSFKGEIMRVQNLYVPVRVKGKVKGFRAPWFSRDIRNLVQKKRDVYNRYRQHGVKELLEEYKECKRNLKKEIRKAKRRYEMRRDLERVDWVKLFYGKDVIEKWRSFKGEIMRVQNLYVPVRLKGKVKDLKAPWFSRDIRNLVRKKRDVYNRYRQHGVKELLEEYKECKRNLKKEIRKAKRRYEKFGSEKEGCLQ